MNYQTLNMAGDASTQRPGASDRPPPPGEVADPSDNVTAPSSWRAPTTSAQSFTPRSLAVGLIIGALITFSNTYFGLQTGWISTMAMPSALIGFSVFKVLTKYLSFPFTPIENVLIQTVAGAVGTMPLGCGFVGVIPALEFLLKDGEDGPKGDGGEGEGGPLKLGFWKLVVWSLGVCLFGVVFAVPLRKEVIVREKLRFPSGTASALMLRVLHGAGKDEKTPLDAQGRSSGLGEATGNSHQSQEDEQQGLLLKDADTEDQSLDKKDWRSKMRLLIGAFVVSGIYVRPPFPSKFKIGMTNEGRLFSRTLCLQFAIFLCLDWDWPIIGYGPSTHHQHISARASSWAHRPVCTCFLEQCWVGESCRHWPRLAAGPRGLWIVGMMGAKHGLSGFLWPSCLQTHSSASDGW
jgi:hypothetical protein